MMHNILEHKFQNLYRILQIKFPIELKKWINVKKEYFILLEEDLENLLKKSVHIDVLRACYLSNFTKNFNILETIYEIHFGSLLTRICDSIELRVSKTRSKIGKNFDFKMKIANHSLNFEVETRKDLFPFRGEKIPGTPIFSDQRETVDQRLFDRINKGNPESNAIRDKISEGSMQLPDGGFNFVALGQIFVASKEIALWAVKNALYGDLYHVSEISAPKKLQARRLPNGLFSGLPEFKKFNKLNGIIWFQLERVDENIHSNYHIFLNRYAKYEIPDVIKKAFKSIF